MSKTLGRYLVPITTRLKGHVNTYRWLGVPSGSISAFAYPSKLIQPSLGYLFAPPWGSCKPKQLEKKLFYSVEGRVWSLDNAMATHRASHYNDQAELIWELSEQFCYFQPSEHPDFHFKWKRCLEKVHKTHLETISLIIDGSRNIYHWLFDALPRLHLIEKSGVSFQAIYVDNSRPFVSQSFEILGLKVQNLFDASQIPAIQAKKLIVPSFVLYAGKLSKPVVPMWALQWLRDRLGSKSKTRTRKRIFISRKDATYRFLTKEDEYFEKVRKYGFERYELSSMSLKNQIQLFADSECIIAPHGAGLANIVFCEPGTKILELFHPGFVQDCYWQIASALGLNYYCMTGRTEGINLNQRYPFADIDIDNRDFEKAIAELEL